MAQRSVEVGDRRVAISRRGMLSAGAVLASVAAGVALAVAAVTPVTQEQTLPTPTEGLGRDTVSFPIAPDGVASCGWSQLQTTHAEPETPGDLMFGLRLASNASPCALPWQPRVWIVDPQGTRYAVRSYPSLYPGRLFLPRAAEARGGVAVDSACGVALPIELVVELADGPRPVARSFEVSCNRRIGVAVSATDFAWTLR